MRVHLIDGTYELFRAYYGAPSARAPDGREVGAVRTLARQILSLMRRERVTHVAVAFDHVIESFRNRLFAGYKSGEGLDPVLWAQFGPAEELARALGWVVWPMVEFECDDALASGAARFGVRPEVEQVVLCSPDKDQFQCIQGQRIVAYDSRKRAFLDEQGVRERLGISPASVPDYLALVGDAADGIPGVPGWGAVAARTLLAVYPRLEAIPHDVSQWSVKPRGAPRLCAALLEHAEQAALYKVLATLRRDVPLEETLEDLEWRGPRPELASVAQVLGDRRLEEEAQRLARELREPAR